MCGITSILITGQTKLEFDKDKNSFNNFRNNCIEKAGLIRHRGPDWSGNITHIGKSNNLIMAHERLEIVDPYGGSQPLKYTFTNNAGETHHIYLCVNGEIYNHLQTRSEFSDFNFSTHSDCEVIIPLYFQHKQSTSTNNPNNPNDHTDWISKLDGQYSFVLYDTDTEEMVVCRDPIGITSLYYGFDKDSNMWVSSEMKVMKSCTEVKPFPNGHYMSVCNSGNHILRDYYSRMSISEWRHLSSEPEHSLDLPSTLENVRATLINGVKKRLMSDVPFGMLLSGGLDSSLVTSIATKLLREENKGENIKTFSIGLEGSPDLEKAQEVADFLGTKHYSFNFTVQEGLDAIRDVIYHLETYDITTVRASTPMYLLSRRIKALGVKMVLSGEGADELLGGYLYFHQAPSPDAFYEECCSRVNVLSFFDCLRANKSTMAWGVEGRFPFLDLNVIDTFLKLPTNLKLRDGIEKWVLRKAFDKKSELTGKPEYLPDSVLWRQKEQFSDGVGYSWIDSLVEKAGNMYTNEELKEAQSLFKVNPPKTKEALMYRVIFTELFPNRSSTVKQWIPRTDWDNVSYDPSGRAQVVHQQLERSMTD